MQTIERLMTNDGHPWLNLGEPSLSSIALNSSRGGLSRVYDRVPPVR